MSAEFSADAERRALEPWSLQIGGRVYIAELVSRKAVLAFLAVVERSKLGTATPAEEEVAFEALFRVAFPWRLRYWWSGDPVKQLMADDFRIRQKALASFFESLAPVDSPTPPGTNGTNGSRPSSAAGNGSLPAPAAAVAGASRLD